MLRTCPSVGCVAWPSLVTRLGYVPTMGATDREDATMCEQCREFGITGRESYTWRLEDGQRVTLCLSHARAWRGMMPVGLRPVPYGRRTRDAIAANAIVGVTA